MATTSFIIVLVASLASLTVIERAASAEFLNGGLKRGVAGGTASFVGSGFLEGYTNLDSYLAACANGSLGITGFFLIGSLLLLAGVWVNNLLQVGQAIR